MAQTSTITINANVLGRTISSNVNITEELVEQIEFTVPPTDDYSLPVGIDDVDKIKAIVITSSQPISVHAVSGDALADDAWEATTAYIVGDIVKNAAGTKRFKCVEAGTSDATEPASFATAAQFDVVADDTATWVCLTTTALEVDIPQALLLFGTSAKTLQASGSIASMLFTNAGGTAALVKGAIIRSAD